MKRRCVNSAPPEIILWGMLHTEIIVQHIIGLDLEVYRKLICTTKTIESDINTFYPVLYRNLVKHCLPNEYILFYEALDTRKMGVLRRRGKEGACSIECESGKFLSYKLTGSVRIEAIDPNRHDVYSRIVNLLPCNPKRLSFLQIYRECEEKWVPLLTCKEVVNEARNNIDFAIRVSSLFGVICPFGIPDSSYYMAPNATRRQFLFDILFEYKKVISIPSCASVKSHTVYVATFDFIVYLHHRTLTNESLRWKYDRQGMNNREWPVRFIKGINLSTYKELTIEEMKASDEYKLLATLIPALTHSINEPIDNSLRYIDTIKESDYQMKMVTHLPKHSTQSDYYRAFESLLRLA